MAKYLGKFKVPLDISIDLSYLAEILTDIIAKEISDNAISCELDNTDDKGYLNLVDDSINLKGEYRVLADVSKYPATYYEPEEYDYDLNYEPSEEEIKDFIFHHSDEIIEALQRGVGLSIPEIEDIEEEESY